MLILDPNHYARDPGSVTGRIGEMVSQCGGEMLASRLWNEQKLAYPIKGHRKGVYWLSYFSLEGGEVANFKRACRLNESVLRNLVLKIEPRLVDALVAHARGESPPGEGGQAQPETVAAAEAESAGGQPKD
jgi:small subunit ribosomal protein S6